MKTVCSLLILVLFLACSKEPVPIHFGEDGCSHCRMLISDQRFGGELVTKRGKSYKFDSIECMAAYILKGHTGSDKIYSLWTINFNKPETFIDANQSWYLISDSLKSPMGLNLSSFEDQSSANVMKENYKGEIIRWQEVKSIVKQEWLTN